MAVTVTDTETTGAHPSDGAEVVEVCAVVVHLDKKIVTVNHTLVRPDGDIPPDTSAVHHITRETFDREPSISQNDLGRWIVGKADGSRLIAAHNMEFDREFMNYDGLPPWMCTMRLARHLWPDAPNHKLQTLRYFLGLPDPGGNPHRARHDTMICASMLMRAHEEFGLDEDALLELSSKPILLQVCHLKKHKGEPWSQVPSDYMRWILRSDFDQDTVHTCEYWLAQRRN